MDDKIDNKIDDNKLFIFNPASYPWGPLSNNYYYEQWLDDTSWPTVTHYVHAALVCYPTERLELRKLDVADVRPTAFDYYAKCINNILGDAAKKALFTKLNDNPQLQSKLISTGTSPLLYDNPDPYLGIGTNRQGQNTIGKIYEGLRYSFSMAQRQRSREKEVDKLNKIFDIYLAYESLKDLINKGYDIKPLDRKPYKDIIVYHDSLHRSKIDKLFPYGTLYNKDTDTSSLVPLPRIRSMALKEDAVYTLYEAGALPSVIYEELNTPGVLVAMVYNQNLDLINSKPKSLDKEISDIILQAYLDYMVSKTITDPSLLQEAKAKLIAKMSEEQLADIQDRVESLYIAGQLEGVVSTSIQQKLATLEAEQAKEPPLRMEVISVSGSPTKETTGKEMFVKEQGLSRLSPIEIQTRWSNLSQSERERYMYYMSVDKSNEKYTGDRYRTGRLSYIREIQSQVPDRPIEEINSSWNDLPVEDKEAYDIRARFNLIGETLGKALFVQENEATHEYRTPLGIKYEMFRRVGQSTLGNARLDEELAYREELYEVWKQLPEDQKKAYYSRAIAQYQENLSKWLYINGIRSTYDRSLFPGNRPSIYTGYQIPPEMMAEANKQWDIYWGKLTPEQKEDYFESKLLEQMQGGEIGRYLYNVDKAKEIKAYISIEGVSGEEATKLLNSIDTMWDSATPEEKESYIRMATPDRVEDIIEGGLSATLALKPKVVAQPPIVFNDDPNSEYYWLSPKQASPVFEKEIGNKVYSYPVQGMNVEVFEVNGYLYPSVWHYMYTILLDSFSQLGGIDNIYNSLYNVTRGIIPGIGPKKYPTSVLSYMSEVTLRNMVEANKISNVNYLLQQRAKIALDNKFKDPKLQHLLLGTMQYKLIYNDFGDPILGIGDGTGHNYVGEYLEYIRARLISQAGNDLSIYQQVFDMPNDDKIYNWAKDRVKGVIVLATLIKYTIDKDKRLRKLVAFNEKLLNFVIADVYKFCKVLYQDQIIVKASKDFVSYMKDLEGVANDTYRELSRDISFSSAEGSQVYETIPDDVNEIITSSGSTSTTPTFEINQRMTYVLWQYAVLLANGMANIMANTGLAFEAQKNMIDDILLHKPITCTSIGLVSKERECGFNVLYNALNLISEAYKIYGLRISLLNDGLLQSAIYLVTRQVLPIKEELLTGDDTIAKLRRQFKKILSGTELRATMDEEYRQQVLVNPNQERMRLKQKEDLSVNKNIKDMGSKILYCAGLLVAFSQMNNTNNLMFKQYLW